MDYVKALENVLTHNFYALTNEGDTVQIDKGQELTTVCVETIATGRWYRSKKVVTRLPDGRHFAWQWDQGLTETQESEGPAQYGAPQIQEVIPVLETVLVTRWMMPEVSPLQETLF